MDETGEKQGDQADLPKINLMAWCWCFYILSQTTKKKG